MSFGVQVKRRGPRLAANGRDERRIRQAPAGARAWRSRIHPLLTLIKLKRAAGRPKDLESLAELETLLEEGRA